MSVLAIRLAGPLQSWGSQSRFARRTTEIAPTKSGILGLLASAQGRRRTDPIEDLLALKLAVRTDQPGQFLRDFHTAHHQVTGKAMPLTDRFYLSDAVFVALIEGPDQIMTGLEEALSNPRFPLYLGRRACIPEGRVCLGVLHQPILDSLQTVPWQAGNAARRRHRNDATVTVPVQADEGVFPMSIASREQADIPLSFNPEHRQYKTRMVIDSNVTILNPYHRADTATPKNIRLHDPLSLLEED